MCNGEITMHEKIEALQNIRQVCKPKPLVGSKLNSWFVETDISRNEHQNTRQELKNTLKLDADSSILFYGHRGCGKSTELNKLLDELSDDEYFKVFFSVKEEMNLVTLRAEDLLLIIAEKLLTAAKKYKLNLKDSLLDPVLDYFTQTTEINRTELDAKLEASAGISTDSLIGKLTGIFAKIAGEVKYNAHGEKTTVAELRKRPVDLLAKINIIIEAVRDALKDNQKLIIIVEDIDKCDLQPANEMFVNNNNLLTGIRTNIIFTIPIFLFHSPEANSFRHNFDKVIRLPMIKVSEPDGNRASGFDTVKKIIFERIEEKMITQDALNLLIEKTGGVLRQVFEVLDTAAGMTDAKIPLEKEHIRYGLNQLSYTFRQQISVPRSETQNISDTDLYDTLEEYAKKQIKGGAPKLVDNRITQILLMSCALVEYNGEGWIGVHPLVKEILEDMSRI